jgi:NADPH:quinone reductase-like Zn-dependent oxidoreductase
VRRNTRAETLHYERDDVRDSLKELTAGRGPDAVIDCVGLEAHHSNPVLHAYDRTKQATRAETDRGHALRQMITSVRSGGHRVDRRRVRRVRGQVPDRLADEQVADRPHRPDARPPLPAPAARAHRARRDRPELHHHPQATLPSAPRMYELFKHKQTSA